METLLPWMTITSHLWEEGGDTRRDMVEVEGNSDPLTNTTRAREELKLAPAFDGQWKTETVQPSWWQRNQHLGPRGAPSPNLGHHVH